MSEETAEIYAARRRAMCAIIERQVRETEGYLGSDRLRAEVMAAMAEVPRHLFVPQAQREAAYGDHPLPIGQGQTISQPYIVAIMTELCGAAAGKRVLEIGTGCGYQAAVLAELGAEVYSIERHAKLSDQAAADLEAAGYDKVRLRVGDGALGWPEAAPFDAILVTAAAEGGVPPALLAQLAAGGRLILPVTVGGGAWLWGPSQELKLVEKDAAGELHEKSLMPVAFVPLVRDKTRDR
jgi:protein-L-isoaspartate(D-aspartate) O-methyltransferase